VNAVLRLVLGHKRVEGYEGRYSFIMKDFRDFSFHEILLG